MMLAGPKAKTAIQYNYSGYHHTDYRGYKSKKINKKGITIT